MTEQGPGRPEHITIGTITSPRGVRGEVNVYPHTDRPERFGALRSVWLGRDGVAERPFQVEAASCHGRMATVKLAGVDSRDQAEALRGTDLLVPADEAWPLAEGEYYHFQLIGLDVYDLEGRFRGKLTRVYPGPANDCFAVKLPGSNAECLLPALRAVIRQVDLGTGRMIVDWPLEA